MKKTILAIAVGATLVTSCQKQPSLTTNEYIEFDFNGTSYSYTGSQVGEINEGHTTWYTRIQTAGNASHFELLLNDTLVGTYSLNGTNVSIDFGGDLYRPDGNTNPLKAIITKYESVRGIIEGTFGGDVRQYMFGDSTVRGTITNGKFKVTRDHIHS